MRDAETSAGIERDGDSDCEPQSAPMYGASSGGHGPRLPPRFAINNNVPADFMSSTESTEKINALIEKISTRMQSQEHVNRLYDEFVNIFVTEMQNNFREITSLPLSSRKLRFTKKDWWDDELADSFKCMQKAEHEYIKAKKKRSEYKSHFSKFKDKQNVFDRMLKRKKRNYQRSQYLKIEEVNSSDPTSFWEYIKKLGPSKKTSKIPFECFSDDGTLIYDVDKVLEKWKSEFQNLYSPPLDHLTQKEVEFKQKIKRENEEFENLPSDNSSVINEPLVIEEIRKVVQKSKLQKAAGIDGIVYDILKNEAAIFSMTKFFNLCFESHMVPDIWVQALIFPIPKSHLNDPRVPLNYRGISLLSVVSKLYTSVLNTRLNNFAENNNLIVNEQNGFRSDRSCLDHIFVLQNTLRIRNTLNSHTYCAFIDFKKAFDLVDRDALLYKLRNLGVTGNFYHTIKSLYTDAKSCIKINDRTTDWFDVTSGVRQGDSLSPTLFSLFLNDLAVEIKNLNDGIMIGALCLSILLYADDICLLAPTPEKLQNMLDVVSDWCRKWGMQINTKKTQILHVRNSQRPRSSFSFNCGGTPLAYTDSYKYLGFILHEHLINDNHVSTVTAAASRSFGRIHSIFKSTGNLGINTYQTLYSSYVESIMNYASGVWGFRNFNDPQLLQNRIMRFFLGVHRFAPNAGVKLELDWLECREVRWLNMLRLYNRISKMDTDRLPKIILNWDKSLALDTWGSEIKHIAANIGLHVQLKEGEIYDITAAYNKLLSSSRLRWHLEAQNKPKLRTFLKIHNFDQIQVLAKSQITRYQRSLLSQLKLGILPLKIETERYQGTPLEQRLCKLCDSNQIEDEIHFMFHCPELKDTRILHNLQLDQSTDDFVQLSIMLNSENIVSSARYLESLYRCRKNIMYR